MPQSLGLGAPKGLLEPSPAPGLAFELAFATALAQKQAAEKQEAQDAARKLGEGLKKYKAAHSNLKKALEGVEE